MRGLLVQRGIWSCIRLALLAALPVLPVSAGPYRNAYLSGTMPWHRGFRDVNLCTGNLMKSFTDIQVAPARGAGLVLQRTYNSNDDRDVPFGRGWTHAYDIRMEEIAVVPDPSDPEATDTAVRTDFFGGKHKYKRDADGLYTPPPYLHDSANSDYKAVLETGPGDVNSDTQTGLDGTVKHFTAIGDARVCDYIEDRNENRTNLAYSNGLLQSVTDPSNRVLDFTWTNYGTQQAPIWRITQVTAPLQTVSYDYYLTPNEPGAGGEAFNLKAVHLDLNGLNRTTTYTYTSYAGENGLLASIQDPLGHTVSYQYEIRQQAYMIDDYYIDALWVSRITEPAGVVPGTSQVRTLIWDVWTWTNGLFNWNGVSTPQTQGYYDGNISISVESDLRMRAFGTRCMGREDSQDITRYWGNYYGSAYDDSTNDVLTRHEITYLDSSFLNKGWRIDQYRYGQFGNVLQHWVEKEVGVEPPDSEKDIRTYWPEDKYFQKKSVTDANGNVTTFDYDSRGNLTSIWDARHDPGIDSEGNIVHPEYEHFAYVYNSYGQKISETNLNNVVTTFAYADDWGNLTQVVQDPGQGHLNRTTSMVYDAAGRVTSRTDPMGRTSTVEYNALGQPETATSPAPYAETVTYDYGANGRLNSVTDGRGTTSMAYESGSDRVASVTDPVTGTTSYTYTLHGSPLSISLPGGGQWTYEYFTGQYQYGMLGDNFYLTQDDPNSFVEQPRAVVDDQGRRAEWLGNNDGTFVYRKFNIASDCNSYCETRHYYNRYGQVDEVTGYSYITDKRLLKTETRFHWRESQYDPWQSKLLASNEYTYDDVGNRLTNAISLRGTDDQVTTWTEEYEYDELSRLTSVDYGYGSPQTQTYTFDNMGNRLTLNSTTYGYNAANMLTTLDGQPYATYDASGNQLTGGGRANTWDSQNRLRQCVYNSVTSTFTYGADGLRRSMTVGNDPTVHYALNGQSVIQEGHLDQGAFVPDATYLQSECRIDEASGNARWYVYDGLGSVVAEVGEADQNNNPVKYTRKYDVYGGMRDESGSSSSGHKFVGSLGHTDEDSVGLIYMRARWYDSWTGRFVSEDPTKRGVNWYVYCNDNPVGNVDATGREAEQALLGGFLMTTGMGLIALGSGVPGSTGAAAEQFAAAAQFLADLVFSIKLQMAVPYDGTTGEYRPILTRLKAALDATKQIFAEEGALCLLGPAGMRAAAVIGGGAMLLLGFMVANDML